MRMCGHPRFTVSKVVAPYRHAVKRGRLLHGTAFPEDNGPMCTSNTHLDGEQDERGQRRRWLADIRLNRKSLGNGQVFDPAIRATSFGSNAWRD
jgi:hypothetical protein